MSGVVTMEHIYQRERSMTTDSIKDIGAIRVYLPTGAVDIRARALAPRLRSLRGARIGILDNCKEFADVVLRGVVDALQRDHGVEQVRFWQKSYLGIPSPYAEEMAAHCDAVINGVGH
jgi:hypothetical protein